MGDGWYGHVDEIHLDDLGCFFVVVILVDAQSVSPDVEVPVLSAVCLNTRYSARESEVGILTICLSTVKRIAGHPRRRRGCPDR